MNRTSHGMILSVTICCDQVSQYQSHVTVAKQYLSVSRSEHEIPPRSNLL